MMTQISFLRKLFLFKSTSFLIVNEFHPVISSGMQACCSSFPFSLSLKPQTDAPWRLLLPSLNLTQIPCHNAQSDGACRHKSKYFRFWSYPTPFTRPYRHLNPPFPQQFQHCKPAICHKVIIELSIGEQLTVPPSSLFPPPHLLICSQTGKSKKKKKKNFRSNTFNPFGISLQSSD